VLLHKRSGPLGTRAVHTEVDSPSQGLRIGLYSATEWDDVY
jgi:hypothetical protein